MCPSYGSRRRAAHDARRARLLFEMLQGDVVTEGFRSEAVKEALDLCLSCKSCKSECPTGVDMAAYKAEFLAHYYEGRRRPLRSYAFGLINHWGAVAEYVPGLANFFMAVPPFSSAIKWALGVAPDASAAFACSFASFRAEPQQNRSPLAAPVASRLSPQPRAQPGSRVPWPDCPTTTST
jgi:ferredoxin